jgi:phosphoribosylformylglycinamidine cyclo-ligase
VIVGLESSGLHSNGYTLARKLLDSKKWGKEMLEPTRIYAKPVLEMIENCKITGIAHITGGGFSKLTRLNKNVGFELNNMPKTKPIFDALMAKVGDVIEVHKTFNMGIGMTIIVPKGEEAKIIEIAKKHSVPASVIGRITKEAGVKLIKDGKEYNLVI